jgi:hypothetical protein
MRDIYLNQSLRKILNMPIILKITIGNNPPFPCADVGFTQDFYVRPDEMLVLLLPILLLEIPTHSARTFVSQTCCCFLTGGLSNSFSSFFFGAIARGFFSIPIPIWFAKTIPCGRLKIKIK